MILILMGVGGSGKSTLGRQLADRLGWSFYDADDFHPPTNLERMASGLPLTERDRGPWLDRLRRLINGLDREKRNGILACSALKESYRRKLMDGIRDCRLVYLKLNPIEGRRRLAERQGHFFSSDLLDDQFRTLEEPENALMLDATATPEELVRRIVNSL